MEPKTKRRRGSRPFILALGLAAASLGVSTGMASAQDWGHGPGWGGDDGWRRHEWREHQWRQHEWREHHPDAYGYYGYAPSYYRYDYAPPPPPVYAPPPQPYNYDPGGLSIGFSFR
jgi:hypothetical protein